MQWSSTVQTWETTVRHGVLVPNNFYGFAPQLIGERVELEVAWPPKGKAVRCVHSLCLSLILPLGCSGKANPSDRVDEALDRETPEVVLPSPTLRRLTRPQYDNAIHALLGEGLLLPASLEPDETTDGLRAIGASLTTISPRGVEQYEDAAFELVEQALADEELRANLVGCEPSSVDDPLCAEEVLSDFGLLAWRRPLSDEELTALVDIAGEAGTVLDDFYQGLAYGLAGILQSPNFLFRVELGEDDPETGERRFSGYEMASRLSFLLWNTIPDRALLNAAEIGALTDDEGLAAQVERMMADPHFEDGVRALFTDMWTLHELEDLTKDPTIFTHMSPEVGSSATEETLLGVIDNVVESDGDFRELFTTRKTFLDRKMASIYNVRAPVREGFAEAVLEVSEGRRGFLGQASFLALQSHPVNTSATLRGQFVREVLLCQYIPPPPSDVDTSIPEASATAVTLRERVAVHLEDEYCATCHKITDPIGLGFEQFDGLGHYRTLEGGAKIDPSGDLDGKRFKDAWELTDAIAHHEELAGCLARTALAYGSGHSVTDGEEDAVDYLRDGFTYMGHSTQFLLADMIMSPAFRLAGEME